MKSKLIYYLMEILAVLLMVILVFIFFILGIIYKFSEKITKLVEIIMGNLNDVFIKYNDYVGAKY